MSFHEIDNLLNKKSGFAGLSGVADLRSVLQRREQGDERASAAYAVSLLPTSAEQQALQLRCSILIWACRRQIGSCVLNPPTL